MLEALHARPPTAIPARATGCCSSGTGRTATSLRLMAAARSGIPGAVAPGGVYACASEKEEFGLALLEAMGSGLSVMGPGHGRAADVHRRRHHRHARRHGLRRPACATVCAGRWRSA